MTPNVKLDKDAAAEVLALASTVNRASVFNVWLTLALKVQGAGIAKATAMEIAEETDLNLNEVHDVLDLLTEEGLIKPSKQISSYFIPSVQEAA